jgi:CRISPR-associated protein Cmr2
MPRHLLLVNIGPVQGFIAQAKRTRDLWLGSQLLSDVSSKAAQAIKDAGGELIFPADVGGKLSEGIANKILALVGDDPGSVAAGARDAARKHLADLWKEVREKRQGLIDPAALPAAEEQIETALEVHAAWACCPDDEGYAGARQQVEEVLAGRRLLHDFAPWRKQRGGVHKSSLDGVRETVLHPPGRREHRGFADFRIGKREELDAVGLLKRTAKQPGQFVPVTTIGLAAWVQRAQVVCPEAMRKLIQVCGDNGLTGVSRQSPWVQAFPFDSQIFLPGRVPTYFADNQLSEDEAARLEREIVKPVLEKLPQPYPYVACLAADGDRMGDAIDKVAKNGHGAHRKLSDALAGFAADAKRVVEQEHRGVLVYAGGDDVLAFVTLPDALACARALAEAFHAAMMEVLAGVDVQPPTLSVGLGIGHVLNSLADLLALGREAEHEAKRVKERNRLAIVLEMRAGARSTWSESWTKKPVERLGDDIALLDAGTINHGKLHELEVLRRKAPVPAKGSPDGEAWARILRSEALRILGRIGLGAGGAPVDGAKVGLGLDGDYQEVNAGLGRFIERVSVAEVFRRANPNKKGAPP